MTEVPIKPIKIPKISGSIIKSVKNMLINTPGIAKAAIGKLIKRDVYPTK